MEQVKFYSKEDMASGYNLTKAENIIDSFDGQKEYNEINELIEKNVIVDDLEKYKHTRIQQLEDELGIKLKEVKQEILL